LQPQDIKIKLNFVFKMASSWLFLKNDVIGFQASISQFVNNSLFITKIWSDVCCILDPSLKLWIRISIPLSFQINYNISKGSLSLIYQIQNCIKKKLRLLSYCPMMLDNDLNKTMSSCWLTDFASEMRLTQKYDFKRNDKDITIQLTS